MRWFVAAGLLLLVLGIAIVAVESGPKHFTWKDTTGRDRDICVAVADMNECDRRSGVSDKLGSIARQDADARSYECMTKHGWVLADAWGEEDGPLHCSGKAK